MPGRLLLLASLAAPLSATAQDWATREVCTVETPAIHATEFPAPGLDGLLEEAAQMPNHRGRFWQITAPNGAVSHLFGTFHSSDAHILRLTDPVKQAIAAAETVALEIDYTLPSRDAYRAAQYIPERYVETGDPFAVTLPNDDTIAGLPPKVSNWIIDRAIELGWTEDAQFILSPAGMAEMLLSDPCEDLNAGILPLQDGYIQTLGHIAGARILGLEEPTAFFTDLADKDDVANAITAVYGAYLQPATSNHARATSLALYLEGRLGLMFAWDRAYLASVLGESGEVALALTNDYLIDFRNIRFLDGLEDALQNGGTFVALGAGHLPGDAGMVEGLRARGYTLTRIPLPGEAP